MQSGIINDYVITIKAMFLSNYIFYVHYLEIQQVNIIYHMYLYLSFFKVTHFQSITNIIYLKTIA